MKEVFPIIYLNQTAKMSGAEQSLLSLWKGMDSKFKPILLLPEKGPFMDSASKQKIETIILPELPKWGERNQLKKLIQIIQSAFKLKKIIQEKKAKLIHANSPRIGYVSGLAAKSARIPSIIHVRDIYLSPFGSSLKAFLFDCLADRIIAVSKATKESIIAKRPSLAHKTKVIYNGINFEEIDAIKPINIREKYIINDNIALIGMVGIIHPVKGIDILIKAAPLIIKDFPQVKFFIIGDVMTPDGQFYLQELKELIAKLDLEEKVIFTGYQENIIAIIKSLDILVHPALYPDPLPRAVLEAAACSRPIIASRVGGLPEIIDHNFSGLLFEPGEVKSLAQACLLILKDRALGECLGKRARQKIKEKFTLENHCHQIESLYLELIEAGS